MRGRNLYHLMVESENIVELVLTLQGLDINLADKKGLTPLAIAVTMGNQRMIQRLIEKGADVNWKDAEGHNLAHLAIKENELGILPLLAQYKITG